MKLTPPTPPDPDALRATRPRPKRRRWLRRAEGLYLAFALFVLLAVKIGGDRWGWATLLAYGPRWLALLPAAPLLAWAVWRRRVPWATLLALLLVAGPLLRFNVPLSFGGGPVTLKVMTFNTESPHSDAAALERMVADERPDVVALQEWRTPLDAPEWAARLGWHTRNEWGVVLTSRFPILQSRVFEGRDVGGEGRIVGCELELPGGRRQWVFSVHLETPRRAFEPLLKGRPGAWGNLGKNVAHRARLNRAAADWVAQVGGEDAILLGDFNLVGDGRIFRDVWSRWTDAFERVGRGYGFTKTEPLWSLRIDHVLSGGAWRPLRCWVGPDLGSDHLPLIAEFGSDPSPGRKNTNGHESDESTRNSF